MSDDDPISAWLRGQDAQATPQVDAPEPRPARRMWALAALPWVAVAALLLMLLSGVGRSGAGTVGVASSDEVGPTVEATSAPDNVAGPPLAPSPAPAEQRDTDGPSAPAGGLASPGTQVTSSGPATTPADPAVGAAAVLAVREALTGTDAAGTRRAVDHAVVDANDRRGDLTLVGVTVVLREGDEKGWRATRTARYAVPIADGGASPKPMGPPWPLPLRTLELAAPPWQELEHAPDAAALDGALAAAGWADVAVEGVRGASELGVLELQVHGRAPGADRAAPHLVWVDASDLTVLDPSAAPPLPDPGDASRTGGLDPEEHP